MIEPVSARLVKDLDFEGTPGDIEFIRDRKGVLHSLMFCCPGCATVSMLPIRPAPPPGWSWDGNEQAPTLSPSIHHNNGSCGWHGHLTSGVFIHV